MDFQDYLVPGKTGLLIGIGGVSMSPLAEVLHDAGLDIRGSDMSESDNTLTLRERGIPIHIGHSAANVTDDIEFVIRTAAVHDDNPEVHEAHRRGIRSLSGRRHGARSCAATRMRCVFPAHTARRRRRPCARTS